MPKIYFSVFPTTSFLPPFVISFSLCDIVQISKTDQQFPENDIFVFDSVYLSIPFPIGYLHI